MKRRRPSRRRRRVITSHAIWRFSALAQLPPANPAARARATLLQRRERRRDAQRVLLLDQDVRHLRLGRPDAFADGFGADARTLGGVLVGPDVDILVEHADLAVEGADQRRQLGALADRSTPALEYVRDRARLVDVGADLVAVAERARLERRRERR